MVEDMLAVACEKVRAVGINARVREHSAHKRRSEFHDGNGGTLGGIIVVKSDLIEYVSKIGVGNAGVD